MAIDPYRIPVAGNWILRVNSVANILAIPCTPSPAIWVEAFWGAEALMFWSLFKPDTIDTYKEISAGHHKGSRKKRMKGANLLRPLIAPKGAFGAALFLLGEVAERVGWYLMVVEAGTNLALNWTSTVYEWAGCISGERGPCELQGGDAFAAAVENGRPPWGARFDPDNWSTLSGISVPAGIPVGVSLAWAPEEWAAFPEFTATSFCKIVCDETGEELGSTRSVDPKSLFNSQAAGFFRKIPAQTERRTYTPIYTAFDGVGFSLGNSTMTASSLVQSDKGLLADP